MEKVMPALTFEPYGLVNNKFNLNIFKERGHYPAIIELSDLNLSAYAHELRAAESFPILGQQTPRGSAPNMKCLVSVASKLPGRKVSYNNLPDAQRVNSLFMALKETSIQAVGSLRRDIRTAAMDFLKKRLRKGDAFRVCKMRTVNFENGHICDWKAGSYNVEVEPGKLEKEKRLLLVAIDEMPALNKPWPFVTEAVGALFVDQCTLGVAKTPMCSISAEQHNNQCVDIWK